MPVEIRTIAPEEMDAWTEAMKVGFHVHAHPGEGEWRRDRVDYERTFAAVDGGRMVGTARSFPTEITLPGGTAVPVGGLTNVTVHGTHRRQGLARRMLEADLAMCRERGEAASILIAAEWPIYGRFGYGPATETCTWMLDAAAEFVSQGDGTVEAVTPEELLAVGPAAFERARVRRPGHIRRLDFWWPQIAGVKTFPPGDAWKGFQVVARDGDGEVSGYCSYTVEDKWEERRPRSTVVVSDWVSDGPGTSCRLWRHLAQLDWVTAVKSETHSVDEPLRWWLADGRHAVQTGRHDFVWLRPLDPARLLASRRSRVPGTVVVEVVDPEGVAAGTWRWASGPDGGECTATTASPEVTLTAAALGAVLLGGTPVAHVRASGLLQEHADGAASRVDALLGWDTAPWCNDWF